MAAFRGGPAHPGIIPGGHRRGRPDGKESNMTGTTEKKLWDSRQTRVGYHLLLGILLLLIALQPWANHKLLGVALVKFPFALALLAALYAVAQSRRVFTIGIGLMVPGLAFTWGRESGIAIEIVGETFSVAFILFIILVFLTRIFTHKRVDSTTISGAICVYLFVGILWSLLFDLVAVVDADAFSKLSADPHERRQGLFYLSFVTLTTLGYGDITPVTPVARVVAILEATIGQIFLVVLVARFVGLQVVHMSKQPE